MTQAIATTKDEILMRCGDEVAECLDETCNGRVYKLQASRSKHVCPCCQRTYVFAARNPQTINQLRAAGAIVRDIPNPNCGRSKDTSHPPTLPAVLVWTQRKFSLRRRAKKVPGPLWALM